MHAILLILLAIVRFIKGIFFNAIRGVKYSVAITVSIIAIAMLPLFFEQGPYFDLAGRLANSVLKHELPPADREGQPVPAGLAYSAEPFQPLGGRADGLGCSLPWLVDRAVFERKRDPDDDELERSGIARSELPGMQRKGISQVANYAPISLQMRQACTHHDYCYRHGAATYGYSQAECDYMLQVHALRLCRFFSTKNDKDKCHTKARLLTIGVRVFGAKHFLPNIPGTDGTETPTKLRSQEASEAHSVSTYFEFDPYPTRSPNYRVARIADTPEAWRRDGARAKALYVFDVKPSGIRLRVVAWKPDQTMPSFCGHFYLPGGWGRLTTPPFVARSRKDGTATDWFVFWQRHSLEGTGGQFVFVSPRHASSLDWSVVANNSQSPFGRTDIKNVVEEPLGPNCSHKIAPDQNAAPFIGRASAILDIRTTRKPDVPRDDFNISEFYAVNDESRTDGLIRIIGLDRSACQNRQQCVHELRLDPTTLHLPLAGVSESFRTFKPLPQAATLTGTEAQAEQWIYDQDIYRSFVTPPVATSEGKDAGHTLLHWFRRETANGQRFEADLTVRRHWFAERGLPSEYAGEVKLSGLLESHEPFALLGANDMATRVLSLHRASVDWRSTTTASIVSLMSLEQQTVPVQLSLWTLPIPYRDPWTSENRRYWKGNEIIPQACRDALAQPIDGHRPPLVIHPNWVARPPVLMGRGPKPFLLLSQIAPDPKVRETPADNGKRNQTDVYGQLDIARIDIYPDGRCMFHQSAGIETALKASTLKTPEARIQSWKRKFEKVPVLLVDVDGAGRDSQILVPDLVVPSQSVLAEFK